MKHAVLYFILNDFRSWTQVKLKLLVLNEFVLILRENSGIEPRGVHSWNCKSYIMHAHR